MHRLKPKRKKTYIVGIGASAGGLEAIQALVSNLPDKISEIAIVIAQHLSPDYQSVLAKLLSKRTSIELLYVKDKQLLNPGNIYISPPSEDLVIEDGIFRLRKFSSRGAHPSVDILFSSIGAEAGKNSAGIILSGTGSDGRLGIEDIKAAGGKIIVQDPSSAKYEGMPISAIETEMADNIMSPKQIGLQLTSILRGSSSTSTSVINIEKNINTSDEARRKILDLLEQRKGIDFSNYKVPTLHRRIRKRVNDGRFKDEIEYLIHVVKHPQELDSLFQVLLIGVTTFFRNPDVFKAVKERVSSLIDEKSEKTKLRLWIPGCATGEEAYTYAIILNEINQELKSPIDFQIFATDIDTRALQKGRLGVYQDNALKELPKNLLTKYFKELNNGDYRIDKSLRKQVLFSRQDVAVNPPFLRLDLISCRNLLIYFDNQLQKRVLPLFYYALNPGGYLVLGKSENIGNFQNLFADVDSKNKIFKRKNTNAKVPRFPYLKPARGSNIIPAEKNERNETLSISDLVRDTIYNSYEHPYVVIDESMDIIEINGEILNYVHLKPGIASLNLAKLISPDFQTELRTLFVKTSLKMKPIYSDFKLIKRNGKQAIVRLSIKPLLYSKPNTSFFLVSFQELEVGQDIVKSANVKTRGKDSEDPRILVLEQELGSTKEHMSSLVEELETANEELQAVNEELQASNEELQASNEELETSNEELQATNDELQNAYSELREAHEEISKQKKDLARSARYMDTTLNNTLVGFIMIDSNFKIKAINHTARKIFKRLSGEKLNEGDSYFRIFNNDQFGELQINFSKALRGKRFVSEENLKTKTGKEKVFNVNYSPVTKEPDNGDVNHVVLSIIDITDRKKAEKNLVEANEKLFSEKQFLKTLAENLPSLIWTMNEDGEFTYCNKQHLNYFGKSLRNIKKMNWLDFVHPEDKDNTVQMWNSCIKERNCLSIEHRLRHKSGDYRWYLTYAEPVLKKDKSINFWVAFSTEIESLKKKSELELSVSQLTEQRSELIKLNRAKDDFVALASHQLRTPASAVKQYIKMILDEYAGPYTDEQGRYLQTAYTSNERQLNIINDLLKTAQVDGSGYNVNKQNSSIVELCQQIAEELKPVFDLKNQKLEIDYDKDVKFRFDKSEIKLVLENLIINANKYSYHDTTIKVKVRHTKKYAKVSVIDEGVGINPENAPHVFDKFTRIDNDLSDTVTGTGLGLYISRKIIEAHQGTIEAKPNKRKGTTFTVKIPL